MTPTQAIALVDAGDRTPDDPCVVLAEEVKRLRESITLISYRVDKARLMYQKGRHVDVEMQLSEARKLVCDGLKINP
jgi:hypothetical protein